MDKPLRDHVGTLAGAQQEAGPGSRDGVAGEASRTPLTEAAKRALAEAAERRAEIDRRASALAARPELNGRGGLEPVRYEDWEIAGRAVDF